MMEMSTAIGTLATALAKAQAQIKGALKDSSNPFFKTKYADLSSVWEACRKPLTDNELAVVQTVSGDSSSVVITTMLVHASGEWIRDSLSMTPVKQDPQGAGSAITYARRYALAAIAGVAPEDDDGNTASGKGGNDLKPTVGSFITDKQAADLTALLEEVGADKVAFCAHFKCESVEKLPVLAYQQAVSLTTAKKKKGEKK